MIPQPANYWTENDSVFLRRLGQTKYIKNFHYLKENTIWHIIVDNSHNIKKQEINYMSILVGFMGVMAFLLFGFTVNLITFCIFVSVGGFSFWYIIANLRPAPVENKYYLLTNTHFYIFHDLGKSVFIRFIKYLPITEFTAVQIHDNGIALYTDSLEPIFLEIPPENCATLRDILLTLRPNDIIDAEK